MDSECEPLAFYQNVSTSKELRDASNAAEVLMRDYGVEASMRLDVYHAKLNAQKNLKASGEWDKLSSEQQRLVDKMVRSLLRSDLGAEQCME
jgi:Zn-dependent oligopeptidase